MLCMYAKALYLPLVILQLPHDSNLLQYVGAKISITHHPEIPGVCWDGK